MVGRKEGYTHSEETKEKMRRSKLGRQRTAETKSKISQAMMGNSNATDKSRRSEAVFQEMRSAYPGCEVFFDENKENLISMFEDIRSENELDCITKYKESEDIQRYRNKVLFNYPSSATSAQEELVVSLVDYYWLLSTFK